MGYDADSPSDDESTSTKIAEKNEKSTNPPTCLKADNKDTETDKDSVRSELEPSSYRSMREALTEIKKRMGSLLVEDWREKVGQKE